MGPFETGPNVVTVYMINNGVAGFPASRTAIELRPGMNHATIPIPVLHTVTVFSPEWKKGTGVYLNWAGPEELNTVDAEAGDDGRVVFERIPAGEYDVVEWPRTMRVRVPQQTHVRFEGVEKED